MTNLPATEESFENGTEQATISLEQALAAEGASRISPYGGVVLSAALFGHNFQHLHRTGPNERPEDIANGEFWKRHRKMDNVLSNTFMFLPDHLRLPYGLRDMNTVFLHMNIHASSICLHQAAVQTAERHKTGSSVIRQSRSRSIMAAEEITNLMRLVSHVDATKVCLWWNKISMELILLLDELVDRLLFIVSDRDKLSFSMLFEVVRVCMLGSSLPPSLL